MVVGFGCAVVNGGGGGWVWLCGGWWWFYVVNLDCSMARSWGTEN